jgi:C-terminal processing protease CtpA/Prc
MVLRTRDSVPRALGPSVDDILSKTTTDVLMSVKTEVKDRISKSMTDEVSNWAGNIEGLIANLDKEYTSVLDPNRAKQERALRSALAMIRGNQ